MSKLMPVGGRVVSLPVLVLVVSSIGWGLTWLPLHFFADSGLDGLILIMIAFGSAVILLLPWLYAERERWRHGLGIMLLIAIFGGAANVSFQTAIYHGEVVRVMILFYLLPLWSVLGGRLFLGERIDRLRMFTLLAALAGGYLIMGGEAIFEGVPDWIDLLAILSGFALAMNNIAFRASPSLPVASKVAAMFIGVSVFMGGFLLLTAKPIEVPALDIGLLAVLYGAGWLMLITIGTQWGVTHIEAGRASIIIVLEMVVAVVSSVIILDTALSLSEIAGAVLVTMAAMFEGGRKELSVPQASEVRVSP